VAAGGWGGEWKAGVNETSPSGAQAWHKTRAPTSRGPTSGWLWAGVGGSGNGKLRESDACVRAGMRGCLWVAVSGEGGDWGGVTSGG
jgi:hypothetical protein